MPIPWYVASLAGLLACAATLDQTVDPQAPPEASTAKVVFDALEAELVRSFRALETRESDPLYFLSYRATESRSHRINASMGALVDSSPSKSRSLDVEARVGTPRLDSTHQIRGAFEFGAEPSSISLPLEDDGDAIRAAAWRATDRAYKDAQERFQKVKTNEAVKVEAEDTSDDFSLVPPSEYREDLVALELDVKELEERLRRVSQPFAAVPYLLDGSVSLQAEAENRFYVNNEGTRLQFGRVAMRVTIQAECKADDGMELSLFDSFEAPDAAHLPDEAALAKAVATMIDRLAKLRAAPIVEPYAGPAIVMNKACGVFFHEIFGHRIEGHRQKDVEEGQTFTKKVNTSIMPEFLSVHDDPTQRKFGDVFLNGHFLYDDEGVAAQRVPLVENGVLKNFLMSRSPIEGFAASNGHGRCSAGYPVVSRQGNLIVEATQRVPFARLREMLIEEVQKQGKPYGLIFHDISGGFTTTQRSGPQAFKVIPLYVVRVYPDGREDEVVRGVDLVGTPLASISKIVAAADDDAVFNGVCGAESGWVPVSAVAPSVLVTEMEIEKKQKSQERPPLLPNPRFDETAAARDVSDEQDEQGDTP
jgi:TldD protein